MSTEKILGQQLSLLPLMDTDSEPNTDKNQRFLSTYMIESARIAKEHGWDDKEVLVGEFIALCHSELSEALEEYRDGKELLYYHLSAYKPKPEGFAVELADVLIRIFHYSTQHNIPLEEALNAKLAYNETRPYRHGGKQI